MKKEKLTSIMIATMLILSILAIVYTPITNAGTGTGTNTGAIVTVEPQIISGAYPYPQQKFVINVTVLTGGASIDKVDVDLPAGLTYVSVETPDGWNFDDTTYTWSTPEGGDPELIPGETLLFNITCEVAPGTHTLTITPQDTTGGESDPLDFTIKVTPWFHAEISPLVTNKQVSTMFSILVRNNASSSAISKVEITYDDTYYTWTGDYEVPDGWSLSHDPSTDTFTLVASAATYYIKIGSERTFKFNMTSADVGSSTPGWTVKVTNVDSVELSLDLDTYINVDAPTNFVWSKPTGYQGYLSVNGGYIWLNITFDDKYYGADYWPTVKCNDTRFELYKKESNTETIGSAATFTYKFRNNTAIPDGKLVVHFNITDYAGNEYTKNEVITYVDNTAPVVTIAVEGATSVVEDGTPVWYVGSGVSSVDIWVNFTEAEKYNDGLADRVAYDTALLSAHKIGLYINGTWKSITTFTWDPTNKRYYAEVTGVTVEEGKCYELFANITDAARPHNHTSSTLAYLKFDLEEPSAPTFTAKAICGGAVITDLTATDNLNISKYIVYVNGTQLGSEVTKTTLESDTLQREDADWSLCDWVAFSNTLVLKLSGYAGKVANITITAVDYGGNEGPGTSVYLGIPEGTWYPIELHKGWNLISLPLVPNSTSASDVFSLVLKQGAAGVEVCYGFDNQAKEWVMNPTTMTDGNGYWVKMKDYDVLIVQGTPHEEYWGLQPIYYILYEGWNLAGYTETVSDLASWYLSSLEAGSYFRYLFAWDAQNQKWEMIDTDLSSSDILTPGQGFWILLYEDQTLVPPVP